MIKLLKKKKKEADLHFGLASVLWTYDVGIIRRGSIQQLKKKKKREFTVLLIIYCYLFIYLDIHINKCNIEQTSYDSMDKYAMAKLWLQCHFPDFVTMQTFLSLNFVI